MLKHTGFFRIAAALFIVLAAFTFVPVKAAPDPSAFVESLATSAFSTLRDPAITDQERFAKFRVLLTEGVDLPRIGRFVLGSHWKQADEAQQKEYQSLFKNYIIAAYAGRLKDYAEAEVAIKNATANGKNEHIVATLVVAPGNPEPVHVDWRLREDAGQLRVIDLTIEGISMALTQRSEFSSIIKQNGGDVNMLLDRLRSVADDIEAGKQATVSQ